MQAVPPINSALTSKSGFFFLIALIGAGLAGNYFNFTLFLNIEFLFGSIFALLALQFFGLLHGIIAATIIAGYTCILWNHPYAIVIMTAEVAAVGWLMRRRKIGLVLADTIYWLIIGMPLIYIYYQIVMDAPSSNVYIVMIKQAVNGIANALAARLIFTGYVLRSRSLLLPYREMIYNLLAFFVLCPALIMLAIGSRTDFVETDRHAQTTLVQDSRRMTDRLETWVVNRKSAILRLAEISAFRSPQQMQDYLEQAGKSDVNFIQTGLFDRDATTTAFYPLVDELGQSNVGRSFADRPYIPMLKRTLKPMLSEVVMGKTGTPKPIVAMLAPVVIGGRYSGFVAGILDLGQIQEHLDKSTDVSDSLYTLLDKNGNVIMTNHPDKTVMLPFTYGKGTLHPLEKGLSQWMPTLPANTPVSERWEKSNYIAESSIGSLTEWKLVLEQPVAPYHKTLYDSYTDKLVLLFIVLLCALALAEFLSRQAILTIEKLRFITRDFTTRLASDGKKNAWPESGIKETRHLIDNFREMADSLSDKFFEIRQINESLEQRVEERTEALRLALEDAKSANSTMSRLLRIIAHEFRTPLGLLTGSTDILDRYWDRLTPEKRFEQNEHIRSAAHQMSSLVSSVISFNQLGTDSPPKGSMLLDIGNKCRAITAEVQAVWGAGHTCHVVIAPDCGSAMFDEMLLRRIVENLLTNAFRYTPSDGAVSLYINRANGRLCLEVRDTGIGIPEDEQMLVFDRFYRSKNVEGRSGLGLGLSIVYETVVQLGGTIAVTSRIDEGTIMRVEIPVV